MKEVLYEGPCAGCNSKLSVVCDHGDHKGISIITEDIRTECPNCSISIIIFGNKKSLFSKLIQRFFKRRKKGETNREAARKSG